MTENNKIRLRNQSGEQFINAGKKVIAIVSRIKVPIEGNDWRTYPYTTTELMNYQNLGWALGPSDLVIDVDVKPGQLGRESFEKLCQEVPELSNLIPTVKTPSGGYHYYLQIPEGLKLRKKLKRFPGIEFLSLGAYCLIPGSRLIATDRQVAGEYVWNNLDDSFEQTPAPASLLIVLKGGADSSSQVENVQSDVDFENLDELDLWERCLNGQDNGETNQDAENWTVEKVKSLLEKIDNNQPNDDWVTVGMALHNWHRDKGLKMWENWSKGGKTYKKGETLKRWKSFDEKGNGGKPVTLGSIVWMARDAVFDENESKIVQLISKIQTVEIRELELDIVPEIRKIYGDVSNRQKERLVSAYQDKIKTSDGVKIPVGSIRKLLNPVRSDSNKIIPGWCANLVYVKSHSSFFHVETLQTWDVTAFNLVFSENVPLGESGGKQSAFKFVSDLGLIPAVSKIIYRPDLETLPEDPETPGEKMLNIYNHNSVPGVAKKFSPRFLEIIQELPAHAARLLGNKESGETFLDYIAGDIQFPGRKKLFAPVLISGQGFGKSWFKRLLYVTMGAAHVGVVKSDQVASQFNGWAIGRAVTILEELRIKGANRYEAANALKELITELIIQINEKGIKPYVTYNTTNFYIFSNHPDCIPASEIGRRYWYHICPYGSIDEMAASAGKDRKTYFDPLWELVNNHGAELRKWFLERKIPDSFWQLYTAPDTESKQMAISTGDADCEGLDEIRDLLKMESQYYNEKVICSGDLFDDLPLKFPGMEPIQTSRRNGLLKKLGYLQIDRIKIDGKMRRVWAKKKYSKEVIRELLDPL